MDQLLLIALYSMISGITIIVGGTLARIDPIPEGERKQEALHAIVAFGGGIMLAAVAFVLAPRGVEVLTVPVLVTGFVSGSVVFFLLDRALERRGGSIAQLMAMLMDFIPEAIALGAVFAHDHRLGLLLAVFIGLQNLPEGFNAYRDLVSSHFTSRQSLAILTPLSFIGIAAACLGFFCLSDAPNAVAALMVFAAGGIVYLTFQDIAPLSKMTNHWGPALGASAGFMVGMVGEKILG